MREINKEKYKVDVLRVLKEVGKPMWISDLTIKHGLPYGPFFGRNRPTKEALEELIRDEKIIMLPPRYYKQNSKRPRRKIALFSIKGDEDEDGSTYIHGRLKTLEKTVEIIPELEKQIKDLVEIVKIQQISLLEIIGKQLTSLEG